MFSRTLPARLAVAAYPQRDDELFQDRLEKIANASVNAVLSLLNITRFRPGKIIQHVNRYSNRMENLPDDALIHYATDLRYDLRRLGVSEALAGRSFALIREAAKRTVGLQHHDVQLLGGWAMLCGKIAEMETGEGKTLTATLPACTVAFLGLPVHIITVNDYLAERDAQLMKPIYQALGLTVGVVTEQMQNDERRAAYACDITYCTNKQITFDHLRDRLMLGQYPGPLHIRLRKLLGDESGVDLLLRGLSFAIVDEADSVLVDEAVTPLIISRTIDETHQRNVYHKALQLADQLLEGVDFKIGANGRARELRLTAEGCKHAESLADTLGGLWRIRRYREETLVQALSARHLHIKDVHYLVNDGKVKIIDEFTGRLMADRSWQRGLHQLVETKEGCELSGQRETIGQISYQRFFRRFIRLSGMSGTAKEIAREVRSVYDLDVVSIKPHKPRRRQALPESVYRTEQEKWQAVVGRIKTLHTQRRPVLVGTRSVAASEHLSELLWQAKLPHRVLNARQNSEEAGIIAQAGEAGQITVATNMAGRGTDIRLGAGVEMLGGLHVIATERHASGRIDRQLFGRCGRQGDPGSYEMMVSYDDELMIRYGFKVARSDRYHKLRTQPYFRALLSLSDRFFFASAQWRAERGNAGMRRAVLKSEEYLSNTLAFSGRME